MKYLLGAVSAAVLLTSSAFAADMPTKAPVAYPVSPVNWTGCYVGVNGGGGWSREDRTLTNAAGLAVNQAQGSARASGLAAGGQIGCDYQFNSAWVVGVRGMWDWSNIKGSSAVALPNVGNITDETNDTKVKSFGTLTGRLGYLVSPTVMLYGLGGVAWARSDYAISSALLGGQVFTGAATRVGYDVGLGLSWMFMPNWNLWLEYDHIGFASKTVTLNGVGAFAPLFVGVDMKQNLDKVLVGLDYRFSLGR